MCLAICGNGVLLFYLKIPTSPLEDYNLDFYEHTRFKGFTVSLQLHMPILQKNDYN